MNEFNVHNKLDFTKVLYHYIKCTDYNLNHFCFIYAATGELFTDILGISQITPPCLLNNQFQIFFNLGFAIHHVNKHHGVYNKEYYTTKINNNILLKKPVICKRKENNWDLILNVDAEMKNFEFLSKTPIKKCLDWYDDVLELILLDHFYETKKLNVLYKIIWEQAYFITFHNMSVSADDVRLTNERLKNNIQQFRVFIENQELCSTFIQSLDKLIHINIPLETKQAIAANLIKDLLALQIQ